MLVLCRLATKSYNVFSQPNQSFYLNCVDVVLTLVLAVEKLVDVELLGDVVVLDDR